MPQETNQCRRPQCKENMMKIKILTSAVEGFIKEIPTHSCRKENETFYRKRIYVILKRLYYTLSIIMV